MITLRRRMLLLIMGVFFVCLLAVCIPGTADLAIGVKMPRDKNIDVPILTYHKVDDVVDPLSVPPAEFEQQMKYLQENGYHSISPDQLTAYLNYGRPLPDRPVMITFDDGYVDNYVNAYPILKKYDFTATVFIVTGLISQDKRFMNWDQVREMQNDRFVFASHSVTHTPLNQLGPEGLRRELMESSAAMERQLGKKPRYFAYPTGDYSAKIEEQVKLAGYRAAFTIRYGQAGIKSSPYALERIPIFRSQQNLVHFFSRLNGMPVPEQLDAIRNGKLWTPK